MITRLRLIAGLAALAVALFAWSGSTGLDRGVTPVSAQGLELSLDTDISDGPCHDIDSDLFTSVGESFQVAVCIKGLQSGIGVFELNVLYDDTILQAPEVEDEGWGADDNPDANLGTTTWGASLGEKVDCTSGLIAFPAGDKEAATGPDKGRAFISCENLSGPWPLGDESADGVIAVITFDALKEGTSALTVANTVFGDPAVVETGTCNPGVTEPMVCNGATVQVLKEGETPPPQVTAAATAEVTTEATAGATSETTPKATPKTTAEAVSEDGGNDWLWPTVIGVVAAVVVLGLLSLAFYRWRRGRAG